jgi:eukaryotic-like serine/threonine-protein kinase
LSTGRGGRPETGPEGCDVMSEAYALDEQLQQRLPLPLAQLCRRSQNAKTPLERHLAAYYLWEASLKLLGSTAVAEYAELKQHDADLTERLKNLARPSVGHWWEFVRKLIPVLADADVGGFAAVRDLVLGRTRDDLPRAAGLFVALNEALEGNAATRSTVRLSEMFDRMVTYRNRELGHGATGQKQSDFYRRMGGALLAGVTQVLGKLDVLAGRRLVFVGDVRRLASGAWLIERDCLVSEAARRLEPLQLPTGLEARLPRPGCVYVEGRRDPAVPVPFPTLRSLHPLVHYEPEAGKFFFLNARRGNKRIEYVCYSTGEVLGREPEGKEHRELLARVLGRPVDDGSAVAWAARSLADDPAPPGSPAAASRSVGEFELLSRLGQGGMGVVYRAWQPSLGRQVALKCMLRSGDPKAEARFAREILALGRVDHPNIVKVFTSGAAGEQWFYAMELVEGAELSSVCEQLTGNTATDVDATSWGQAVSRACRAARSREAPLSEAGQARAPGAPSPRSPEEAGPAAVPLRPGLTAGGRGYVREVAEIVRQVAGAVHTLHEAGVVHRDIKPGNIMLTAEGGHPVLMDLGLAQIADEADGRLTRTRQFVGTLRYASPEQVLAAGRVDRRTDVYSLGATLWELLTLRPIFGAGEDTPTPDLMLKIQTSEPENIRKYNSHVPPDLGAIVIKCLEKDRARRYATAGDLAEDLGRFLNGEPVSAQPPSFGYMAGKFVSRHRLPLTVAGLVLLLVGIGTLLAFLRIRAERNDAVEAREREEVEKEHAQQALNDLEHSRKEAEIVWNVVDQAYTNLTEDNIRHLPGLSPVHEELASIRLEGIRQLANSRPDDPTVEPKLARARAILGLISSYVGSPLRARENLEESAKLYARLAEKYRDATEYRLQHGKVLNDLGLLFWDEQQRPAARRQAERALASLERDFGQTPVDPGACYQVGRSLVLLGGCLTDDSAREERKKIATRAVRLFERLVEQKYREIDARAGLAVATYRLAEAQFDGKDQGELLKALDRVSSLDRAALSLALTSPYLNAFGVFMSWDKADALVQLGDYKEALAQRETGVAKAREIVRKSPDVGRYVNILAEALEKTATDLRRLKRSAEARTAYEESVQVMDGLVRRFPEQAFYASDWIRLRNRMADYFEYDPTVNEEVRTKQELLRCLDTTVKRGRELASHFADPEWVQENFAAALTARARYDTAAARNEQALSYLLEACEVYRARLISTKKPPSAEHVATYLNQLQLAASCASAVGKGDELTRLVQLALEVRQNCTGRRSADALGSLLSTAAEFYLKAGRTADAIEANKQAIAVRAPALEGAPWDWYLQTGLGGTYLNLAEAYRQAGDYRHEVLANREYLKRIAGPRHGAKIEGYIDDSRPVDEAEAQRIRDLIQTTTTGMKRFAVPCDFNGLKYSFYVYVSNVPWPKHPLEDQARWLKEDRGGTIPKDVMDSFARLQKIARDNDVSFKDLCVYALGKDVGLDDDERLGIDKLGEPSTVMGPSGAAGKPADDPHAALKARVVDLQTKLDNAPDDRGLILEAAPLYQTLGERLVADKNYREGIETLRESARLWELIAPKQPRLAEPWQRLADALLFQGRAQVQLKEFDAAYECFHRRQDILEQLAADAPSGESRSAAGEGLVLFGELAERRSNRIDALRWYALACGRGSASAPGKVAKLIQADSKLVDALNPELRGIYVSMAREGKPVNGPAFVSEFAREFDAVRNAKSLAGVPADAAGAGKPGSRTLWLSGFADTCRSLADELRGQAKPDAALTAYLHEVDLRALIFRLDGEGRRVADDYARALVDAARVSLDLGKDAHGVKLLERAGQLGDEKAAFSLAELYEKGNHVPKDAAKAASLRYGVCLEKAERLYRQKKYDEALAEYERARKEQPTAACSQRIAWCLRALGRAEEALAACKEAVERASALQDCCWLVLDLAKTAVESNRSDKVFALLRLLKDRRWSFEDTDMPYTLERELTGAEALALVMAGKDASEAEKRLSEIVARPNMVSLATRKIQLDEWLKAKGQSRVSTAAVKKILAILDTPPPSATLPQYPLQRRAFWVYRTSRGGEVTVRAVRRDKVGEHNYWLVETVTDGRVTGSERLWVASYGVYRQSAGPPLYVPQVRILPLPARAGDSWRVQSRSGESGEVTGEGTTRLEDVAVPAGEFKGAVVAEVRTREQGREVVRTTWYAKDVGPVKIATKDGNNTVVLELERHRSPTFRFDESGRLASPTAEESQDADADSSITVFDRGTLSTGDRYWAYVKVRTSKYEEYMEAARSHRTIRLKDFGTIVRSGFGDTVPETVKEEMKRDYGCDDHYMERLREQVKKEQNEFLRQQEDEKLARIVDMLKKKQKP